MKPVVTYEQIKQTGLAMIAFSEGKRVEAALLRAPNSWHDVEHPNWHHEAAIFRPKPQPVSRPWSKPEDVPGPVCWIRSEKGQSEKLVTMVASDGIRMFSLLGDHHTFFGWNSLASYEYSTDRKAWKPCTVEDAQ
jgi:hypothetical protein